MNTNIYQGSAKIYQFPVHARRAAADHRKGTGPADVLMPQGTCDVALGDCWYHEAAMRRPDDPKKA